MAGVLWVACAGALGGAAGFVAAAREAPRSSALLRHGESLALGRLLGPLARLGRWADARLAPLPGWSAACEALRRRWGPGAQALGPEQVAGIALCAWCGLACMGAVMGGSPVAGLAVLVAVGLALGPWERRRERRREARALESLPDAYRSLASSLATGRTLMQSLAYVGHHSTGEVGEAFAAAAAESACGSPWEQSLTVLERRLPTGTSGLLVASLRVSRRTGASLQRLLEEAAGLLEQRQELERLLKTKTAQVRLSAQVVMALPAGLVLALAFLSPDYRAGLATWAGAGSLVVAAALDAGAWFLLRSILKGVAP